jgi:putative membrane protein
MHFLLRILITAVIAYVLTQIMKGVHMDNFWAAILFAFVLAVVNGFVRPILILFTIPITLLTMGLFLLVINALMILLVDALLDQVTVDNFWWALLFSITLSLMSASVQSWIQQKDKK